MSSTIEETISLLIKLEEKFTEPDFICKVEKTLNDNLHLFDEGEQSIQCFEVFTEFKQKIETQLEAFVSCNSVSEQEVFDHCKNLFDKDPNALTCFESILAAADYNDFLELMITRRNIQEWRED